MEMKSEVLAEDVRIVGEGANAVEYVSLTCREIAPKPLLQMYDYGLRREEMQHKGKLVGKTVILHINTIRALFAGRPQMVGTLEVPAK
jgi:hypothetical protein